MTPPILKKIVIITGGIDFIIWEAFTSSKKEKLGIVIFFSLTGQNKQTARYVSIENLGYANGVT